MVKQIIHVSATAMCHQIDYDWHLIYLCYILAESNIKVMNIYETIADKRNCRLLKNHPRQYNNNWVGNKTEIMHKLMLKCKGFTGCRIFYCLATINVNK